MKDKMDFASQALSLCVTGALVSSALMATSGFHLDTPSDSPLAKSAPSVFRAATLVDTGTPFTSMSLEEAQDHLDRKCDPSTMSFDDEHNCAFIRACVDQGGMDSQTLGFTASMPPRQICHHYYSSSGSINLIHREGEYAYILTAWHVVQSYHRYSLQFLGQALVSWTPQERLRTLRNMSVTFDVYNHNAQKVMQVNPTNMEEIVFIGDLKGPAVKPDTTLEILGNVLEDIVVMKVRDYGVLGDPLPIARSLPHLQSRSYAIGYPVKTYDRENNADGFSQTLSEGSIQDIKDFHKEEAFVSLNLGDDRYDLPRDRKMIFTTADLVSGNSGGALLNEQGEIFGIVISSHSTPYRYSFRGGIGISVDEVLTSLGF